MSTQLTSNQVWQEIGKQFFAVLGMITAKGESRTIGVNYVVDDRKLYINTEKEAWKTRHVAANPHVSITIPIIKRVALLPWIKVPPATITFHAEGKVLEFGDVKSDVIDTIYRHVSLDDQPADRYRIIEVVPESEFITYGVGIPVWQMRFPEKARGRADSTAHGGTSVTPSLAYPSSR